MAIPADQAAALVQHSDGILTLLGPYQNAVPLTPADTIQFAPTLAVYVANAGTLVVDTLTSTTTASFTGALAGGVSVTFSGMLAGNIYPLRITRAYAAGTSSIGLVGLY